MGQLLAPKAGAIANSSRRGHAFAAIPKACTMCCCDKGCTCRLYHPDETPEFLLRMGVWAGKWQFIPVDQLKFLMRPDRPEMVRVWACGVLHTTGHGEETDVTQGSR